ncbi:mechanosensitive ion channel family protein [Shewanella sp. Scap07]|uniref:mechanosensitive ion channel family protein n=1 Tax=Shewanella sp. Scap07 TaxID=2589987 RepID=UPI0015BDC576|nr:mechanosensitive ion channel family protein [Shewanella sp. Scap07]QLE87040.1 mechanosensitive ion channel family protein [Shewanella sp. Scap07]
MNRVLAIVLLTLATLIAYPAAAETTYAEINQLQNNIIKDAETLKKSSGEFKGFTEYRIKEHVRKLEAKLQELMERPNPDAKKMVPLLESHLNFLDQVLLYFHNDMVTKVAELGKGNDTDIMLALAKRERERDEIYLSTHHTLQWLATLGVDVSSKQATFVKELKERADSLNSFVQYTQDQLKSAVEEAAAAGKDVSAEQTARVTRLNERLGLSNTTLSSLIELLDSLGQDTTELKQTLFSVSGDITQDVLNFDVATSLLEDWATAAQNQIVENGPSAMFKLFIFVLIIFIASLVGKGVQRIVSKTVSNSKLRFSHLLQDFFISLSGKAVMTLGVLIALSQLGFELGPLLAGFGVAGVIIGFALQDTLSNFASGMMILIYRPYDVGDLINAGGVTGKVSHMSLVSTTIKTLDNQRLIIPNNKIWGDTINNITVEHQRRVDMTFGIGYSDDIEKAERVLNSIVEKHPKVLQDPEPMVKLHLLGESSVDFVVRPWAKPEDYWDVYWDITREVKMRFDAENISIPFPQRDVHIYQTKD